MSRIEVSFGGNTGDLEGAIRELTSEFKNLFTELKSESRSAASAVDGEMDKIVQDMRRVEREGQGMALMFGKIKSSIGGIAAGYGLTQIAGYVVKTSVEFERLRSILLTLEGSQANANARFAELQKFAKETPFDLQQVVTAYTRLKGTGLDPSNAALKAYGNTAAATGKSLQQYVEAVTDATVGEMERLKEFNIKAKQSGDQVSFTFNGVTKTVQNNAQEIEKALQEISNENFGDAMENQMKTLGGAFSNLGDVAATTADEIGKGGLTDAIATVVRDMIDAGESSGGFANMLGGVLGQAVLALREILVGFGEVFTQIFTIFGELIAMITGETQDGTQSMANGFKYLLAAINGFGVGVRVILVAVAGIVRFVASSFITLADVVARVLNFDFSGALASFTNWGSSMAAMAKSSGAQIVGALQEGKKRQDAIFAEPPKVKPVKLPGYTPPPAPPRVPKKGSGAGSDKDNSEAEAKRKREEALQAELDALQLLEDAARDNTEELLRLQDLKLAAIKRVHGEESREYRQANREKIRMERDYVQEKIALAREATEHKLKLAEIEANTETEIALAGFDARREAIENAADAGQLNPEERTQALAALLNEEFELERQHEERLFQIRSQAIKDQLALDGLREPEKRRLLADLEIMEAEHNSKMSQMAAQRQNEITRFNNETQRQVRQQWQDALQPIGQAFDGLLQGMLQGTTSFKQGYIQMMDQLVSGFVSRLVQMGTNWLVMELTKTSATQAQEGIRMVTTQSAAATSTAAAATAGTTQVATNAAVGASGAFASVSQIPVIGPFIAPAIAAGAMAAIMGFGRLISARGGADIGSGVNPMAQLHEEEMVLPAHIANPLRSMLAGPRTSGLAASAGNAGAQMRESMSSVRGGDSNFYYQPNNSLSDAKFDEMLRRDGRQMRKWLKNEMRNGNLKMNSA